MLLTFLKYEKSLMFLNCSQWKAVLKEFYLVQQK